MSIPTYIIAAKQLQRENSSEDDDYIKEFSKKGQERKGTMLGLLNNQHPLNFTKILDNL